MNIIEQMIVNEMLNHLSIEKLSNMNVEFDINDGRIKGVKRKGKNNER